MRRFVCSLWFYNRYIIQFIQCWYFNEFHFFYSFPMFATESYVQARRGKKGTPRFVYLQKLVTEYQDTKKLGIY